MADSNVSSGESEQDTPTEHKPVGRPRRYNSPEEMAEAIERYFQTETLWTVCGLALALGFNTRDSLLNYEGYSEEFFGVIKNAKLRIENESEKKLLRGEAPAGVIFHLKNIGSWADRQEITGADGKDFIPPRVVLGGDD